jgi:signal transduction histidine kinase
MMKAGAATKIGLSGAVVLSVGLIAARWRWAEGLLSSDYLPHQYCYLAKPWLVWTNVSADALIGVSYSVIFTCMMWIALRLRRVAGLRPYLWIFISFGLFLVACSGTHWMDVVTLWRPFYPTSVAVKVVCAVVSVPTAIFFAKSTPLLARSMGRFVATLETTEGQRDEALEALRVSEERAEERQKAAQEIASAYARLNTVLECTSDGVATIGLDWTILYGNQKALGSLPEISLGRSYWECFPTLVGTSTEGYLRKAMEQRVEVKFEAHYEPYDQWFFARCFPTEEGISIFFANITEEKAMHEQLELERLLREKRIEALSHMAGGLAHEISNPLAIIHGRASDLRMKAEGDAPVDAAAVREMCDGIVRTSDRAIRILRGLRGFGREAIKDPMEQVSILEIVEPCLELQEARFERHGVELLVELANDLPPLCCRETQVGQILTNLLNNAFDAVVQGKVEERWVRLRVLAVERHVYFDVSDSGPGIEEHLKLHLMKPFFTTKEFGLGTGIGLSLSRAIAQDHGGTLVLLSGTERTCFRLALPVEVRPDSGVESVNEVTH